MRLRAASIHLGASLLVAGLAAVLVFGLWYPHPYRILSGGQSLFLLIVAVDVVLGPLLTLVLFDPRKSRAELARDLAVVAVLQAAALGYGLWTMYQARPVHLVFEVDRFRVVSAADVEPAELPQAPPGLQRLPLTGPTTISARRSAPNEDLLRSIEQAAAGRDIAMQPARWAPYDAAPRAEAWARAQPWPAFDARFAAIQPAALAQARQQLQQASVAPEQVRALPVQSRFGTWSALIDATGEPRAFVPIDPF